MTDGDDAGLDVVHAAVEMEVQGQGYRRGLVASAGLGVDGEGYGRRHCVVRLISGHLLLRAELELP